MNTLLPNRLEGVQTSRNADERTLRLCFSEQDAIVASVALSGFTYREIAARMGVSKSLVNAMAKGERPLSYKRTAAFCNATGTNLVRQYREMERENRELRERLSSLETEREIERRTIRDLIGARA